MADYVYLKSVIGEIFLIPEEEITAGRDYDNAIVINDPAISSQHAVFNRRENQLWVMDLNSSQGTFVNKARLRTNTAHPLNHGDQIGFGSWLTFTVYSSTTTTLKKTSSQAQTQHKPCPNCRQPLKANAAFCTSCGTKLSTAPRICNRCQTPIQTGWKVCPRCGNKLTSSL